MREVRLHADNGRWGYWGQWGHNYSPAHTIKGLSWLCWATFQQLVGHCFLTSSVHLNISPDEHLPAGAENPWTTWKALNRLRSQVGRSRVNMLKWGFSNEQETCDCGIRQTMQHLLDFPMMDTACSPQDLATANGTAIGCAKHWEGTIWRTYDSGGRTRMMMIASLLCALLKFRSWWPLLSIEWIVDWLVGVSWIRWDAWHSAVTFTA